MDWRHISVDVQQKLEIPLQTADALNVTKTATVLNVHFTKGSNQERPQDFG